MGSNELQEAFWIFMKQQDIATVKRLLKHSIDHLDLNLRNEKGISPIHHCCIHGNVRMIKALIKAGADINVTDPEGWTALHISAASGNLEICQQLLKSGADVFARTNNNELPIDFCSDISIRNILKKLMVLFEHALLTRRYSQNRAAAAEIPSYLQTRSRHIASSKLLKPILKTGRNARWSTSSVSSSSSSSSACSSCDEESDSSSFSSDSRTKHSVKFSVNTLFKHFLKENDHVQLEELLKNNVIPGLDKLDSKGLSPIHWAVINGFTECVYILVKYGANIEKQDPHGWTALHAAVAINNLDCVKTLIERNANIFALTSSGESVYDLTTDKGTKNVLNNYAYFYFQNLISKQL